MNHSFFITGTDTGIGKTFVTSYLTASLRKKGVQAVPYKPIQSGGIVKDGQLRSEDVAFYKMLSALPYSEEQLCTYCFNDPVSPHLAMKRSDDTIHIPTIINQLKQLQAENEVVFVEGAGGLAVPLIDEEKKTYMMTDFIKDLQLPLLIVTQPNLGSINHTLMTISYAQSEHIPIAGMIVNQMPKSPNTMQRDNVDMIEKLSGIPIVAMIPPIEEPLIKNCNDYLESHVNDDRLASFFEKLTKQSVGG